MVAIRKEQQYTFNISGYATITRFNKISLSNILKGLCVFVRMKFTRMAEILLHKEAACFMMALH